MPKKKPTGRFIMDCLFPILLATTIPVSCFTLPQNKVQPDSEIEIGSGNGNELKFSDEEVNNVLPYYPTPMQWKSLNREWNIRNSKMPGIHPPVPTFERYPKYYIGEGGEDWKPDPALIYYILATGKGDRELLSPHAFPLANAKRNNGYMCHFKLCQLGASGKRRWNPATGFA